MKRLIPILAGLAIAGCGAPQGQGTLALKLVDAPSTQVQSIFVTIDQVTAHSDQGGWVTVFKGPFTVDLLTLKDKTAPLGQVTLPAGNVSQIRLALAPNGPQYVVLPDGSQAQLTVPSGTESGIKLVGNFPVNPCATHTVTLDFDGEHSISTHATGNAQGWILRPVVRVKTESDTAGVCPADGGADTDGGAPSTPDAGSTGGDDGGVIIN